MTATPVHVVTVFSPTSQQTENIAAFSDLAEAKKLAEEHLEMLGETLAIRDARMFVEEWHGGDFHAHRELRRQPVSGGEHLQWFVSEAPAFASIEELP
jgi:hypothetical protein